MLWNPLGAVLFDSSSMIGEGIGETFDEVHFKNKYFRLYLEPIQKRLGKYTQS